MKQHKLTMSHVKYPGGIRIIECTECSYALVTEVDQFGIVQMDARVKINYGDPEASHSYVHAPQDERDEDIYAQILDDIARDNAL